MERDRLIRTMESILGPEGVISEREQLRSYECDGLMNYRVIPDLVVLPESAEQVQQRRRDETAQNDDRHRVLDLVTGDAARNRQRHERQVGR